MNRKQMRKLQRSFAKRGGVLGISPDAPREVTERFLRELLDCPECRAAVLEGLEGEQPELGSFHAGSSREH